MRRPRWLVAVTVMLAILVLVIGHTFVAHGAIESHPYLSELVNWAFSIAVAALATYSDSQGAG